MSTPCPPSFTQVRKRIEKNNLEEHAWKQRYCTSKLTRARPSRRQRMWLLSMRQGLQCIVPVRRSRLLGPRRHKLLASDSLRRLVLCGTVDANVVKRNFCGRRARVNTNALGWERNCLIRKRILQTCAFALGIPQETVILFSVHRHW